MNFNSMQKLDAFYLNYFHGKDLEMKKFGLSHT